VDSIKVSFGVFVLICWSI